MVSRFIAQSIAINIFAVFSCVSVTMLVIYSFKQFICMSPNIGVNKAAESKFLIHPPRDTVCQLAIVMRMGNKNVGIDFREPIILNGNAIRNFRSLQH